ncbi:MAG: glycosyltransferase [Hespellia sp.]|nr:glycosyltransferase [Hespellia sp.]
MIGFVILHYLDEDCTNTCIKCIRDLEGEKHIVVVDNASENGSGYRLMKTYEECEDVSVIFSSINAGFAKGNNMGVTYARQHFQPDFIVVLNNDVEINQKDFCKRVVDTYKEHPFDMMGPDIISQYTGVHQSPKRLDAITLESVRSKAAYVRRSQNPVLMYLSSEEKKNVLLYRWKTRKKREREGIDFATPKENVILHGSCIIFSRRFFEKRPEPFYAATFMYYEMEILDWICRRQGLVSRYEPSICVLHHQNVSTSQRFRTMLQRSRFVTDCLLDSLGAAERLLLEHSNEGVAL